MEFKFNSNIFKNSTEDQQRLYGDKYDPDKNYPVFTGTASIPQFAELSRTRTRRRAGAGGGRGARRGRAPHVPLASL